MASGTVFGLIEGLDLFEPDPAVPTPAPVTVSTEPLVYQEPLHLRFPLAFSGGDFVMVAQDSQDDVDGCVEAIARCPQGWLDSLPQMGLRDFLFSRGRPSIDEIRAGIEPFEPRAALLADSELEDRIATITVDPGVVTPDGR